MNFSREQIEAAQTPAELTALLSARGSSPRWAVSTLTEVAEFFGVATSTVKGWRMESPPMPGSDGSWPLDAITRWRAAKITGSDLVTAQKQATLEATVLANDARRLGLEREKGELLARDDVERWVAQALISTREVFMSQPETLAIAMPPEHRNFVREESDRICRAALTTLRRKLERDQLDQELSIGETDDGADEQKTRDAVPESVA